MGAVKKYILQRRKNAEASRQKKLQKNEAEQRGTEALISDSPPASTSLVTSSAARTPTLSSAKKRKVEIQLQKRKYAVDDEMLLVSRSYLEKKFGTLKCPQCFGKIKIDLKNKYLDYQIDLVCEECSYTDIDKDKVEETPISKTVVYATMSAGVGNIGLHSILGDLSMKPLSKNYNTLQLEVLAAAKEKVKEVLDQTLVAVKKRYVPDDKGIYNISIIFDGSWQKRGHMSKLAVGAAIEAYTSCVIDYETVSKYCEQCTKKENALAKKIVTSDEYEKWMTEHKEKCMKNFEGNSGAMEAAAAVRLFSRSLEKNVRYTVFISDGDSSAYNAVCELNSGKGPYDGVKIEKGECINHVGKRLGTALRKIRDQVVVESKTKTGKTRRVKQMGGKGKLTDTVIAKLQKYYSTTIRRHVGGTVTELRNDIYSSFLHCSSTDDNPQHHLCPKRSDSWCFYQKALANNTAVPSHKTMKVHFDLPSDLRQKVWGEYKRLTSDKILHACLLGKTQNPNEHLHSRIWRYCSKYKGVNKNILDFAVAKAVVDYNVGYQDGSLLSHLGVTRTTIQEKAHETKDRKRESILEKKKIAYEKNERVDYAAGGF